MGSKKSKPPAPAPIDPVAQAQANVQAQLAAIPQAAQIQFDLLSDPNIGLQAQTQLSRDARESVFTGEADVKNQLLQNVLGELQSPTGISPEQQQAVDERRALAVQQTQEALRNRANLGGGLFGGRSAQAEGRQIGELQNLFAEEDITRQERARLNNQQVALSVIQALFPDVALQQPQFINPVVSPNQQFAGATSQANLTAQLAAQQQQNDSALRSSLFGALGTATGGALGGPLGGAIGSSLFKRQASLPSQSEILGFNTRQFS